jgi:hypothetical protein
MSAKQSSLSAPQYGYDVVVAVSQASINATMKDYLFESQLPVFTMYYNKGDDGNPVAIDYATLMTQTNNTDPFKVTTWDSSQPSNKDIDNVSNSNFLCAFRAEIGIPPCFEAGNIPDIIGLIPGNAGSVTFNLMWYMFTIVQANFDGKRMTGFFNASQPSDVAWIVTSNVPLKTVNDATNLPALVQQQVDSMTGDFTVQKLIVDLGNGSYEPAGYHKGSPVYNALNLFIRVYFKSLKSNGQLALNYSITQSKTDPSTLKLTDVAMEVNAFVDDKGQPIITPTQDQQDLVTLNYLCAANGNKLSPPAQFSWNWLDNPTDASDFNGIIAINRNTLANYFRKQLDDIVSRSCLQVTIICNGIDDWTVQFSPEKCPLVHTPETGPRVLTFADYSAASDQSGWGGALGEIFVNSLLEVSVDFTGNSIVIIQHMKIGLLLRVYLNKADASIMDKTITDTYTLIVDGSGKLSMKVQPPDIQDHSQVPGVNGFLDWFTGINELVGKLTTLKNNFVSTNFKDIPLSLMTNFVFPAGKTFAFKDAFFSDNQDLVAHITYTDPS